MAVPGGRPPDFGCARASRVYDYWLGGDDNLAADRELGDAIEALCPPQPGRLPVPREMAMRDRVFTDRAVRWAAGNGIRQYLILGAGLPAHRDVTMPDGRRVTLRDVHESAGMVLRDVRAAYVAGDALTASHAQRMSAARGVAVIRGDPAAPGEVLADPGVRGCLDFTRPVAVVMSRLLHFFPAARAREITAAYAGTLKPDGCLIITCARCDPPGDDPGLWEKIRAAYVIAEIYNHTRADMASFFTGTRLVPPGVTTARGWRGDWGTEAKPDAAGYILCGVGVV